MRLTMKFKRLLFSIPLLGLLTACTLIDVHSSSDNTSSSSSSHSSSSSNSSQTSEDSSSSSESSSSIEDPSSSEPSSSSSSSSTNLQTFNERINGMVSTGIKATSGDANTKDSAAYNPSATLGSAAHPLLNQPSSNYIEIVAIEQPDQYGDAVLIKCGNAEIIIDVGMTSTDEYDDGTTYSDFLKEQYSSYITDNTVDLMVVSHPHEDHIGGFPAFVDSNVSKIGMLVDYGYRYTGNAESFYYNQIRKLISSKWGGVYHPVYDCVNNLNGGLARTYITQELFIDWVNTGVYQSNPNLDYGSLTYNNESISDLNITSVAGILSYKNFSYFFDGDMQNKTSYGNINGENNMVSLNTNNPLFHKVTMSKIAHHGSSTGTYASLLTAITPKISFISAGRVPSSNSYNDLVGACSGHPHALTLSRIKSAGIKAYLNSASGTLHFVTDGGLTNPIYFVGAPLKSSLLGGTTSYPSSLNLPYGSTTDMYNDLWNTTFYNMCHA